jgi:hypothetical protein
MRDLFPLFALGAPFLLSMKRKNLAREGEEPKTQKREKKKKKEKSGKAS